MGIVIYIVATLLVFTVIVAVHEFGHMIVAKWFGVGVVEYSIGMGPVIYSKRKKDTCYSLRALPIGGFCAMYGEKSLEANDKGEAVCDKPSKCDFKKDWSFCKCFMWFPDLCYFGCQYWCLWTD